MFLKKSENDLPGALVVHFLFVNVWLNSGVSAETKLKEYPVAEKDVLQILTQVNVTRRECEIVCIFISLDLVLFVWDYVL